MLVGALLPEGKLLVLLVGAAVEEPGQTVADGLQRAQLLFPQAQALLGKRRLHRADALVEVVLQLVEPLPLVLVAFGDDRQYGDQQHHRQRARAQGDQLP